MHKAVTLTGHGWAGHIIVSACLSASSRVSSAGYLKLFRRLAQCLELYLSQRDLSRVLFDPSAGGSARYRDNGRKSWSPTVMSNPSQRHLPDRASLLVCNFLHMADKLEILLEVTRLDPRKVLSHVAICQFVRTLGSASLSRQSATANLPCMRVLYLPRNPFLVASMRQ